AERLQQLLEADGVVILLVTPPAQVSTGFAQNQVERLGERAFGRERLDNAERDPRFSGLGLGSILSVPLLSAAETVGTLVAGAERRMAFSVAQEEMLASLARCLIGDLDAARAYRMATIDPETRAGTRHLLAERLPDE